MQYRSLDEVLAEGAEFHKAAREKGALSRKERLENYAKAERCYLFVLEHFPEDALTLGSLGSLYVEMGKWSLGIPLLSAATRLEPEEPGHLNALGAAYRRVGKVEKAREIFIKALELPKVGAVERSHILHNMASTYVNEGDPESAVKWALESLKYNPDSAEMQFNLGLAYLELGDYAKGWDGYELGRIATTWKRNYSHPGRMVEEWDGSPGKHVVVFGEQGVGDEILFAHAIPDLLKISKSVVIECHPRLVNLFKNSFPECAVYGTRKDEQINWPANHVLDAKVPIGSLHRFFRRHASDFPVYPSGYIKPDPALVGQFAGKSGKLRVGVSWIGGTRDTHVALRSMPLENLAPILSVPGVEFVSLQYTENAGEEVAKAKAKHGWDISHDNEMNADLDQLFGCIAGLDLVITVLTSNVHFAGSMNVPTWCLTPIKSPWQFTQKAMPWYPQAQLYRQSQHGQWGDVIGRMAGDLKKLTKRQAAE